MLNEMNLKKFIIIEAVKLCTDEDMITFFEVLVKKMITPDIKRKRTVEERYESAEAFGFQGENLDGYVEYLEEEELEYEGLEYDEFDD